MVVRPDWDSYFLTLAEHAASRATCPRLSVGAVVVRDKRVLSTGYNGTPAGEPHCSHDVDTPCREATHAERNALDPAFGPFKGATMYLTHSPCATCQWYLVEAFIARVVYRIPYRNADLSRLTDMGIVVEHKPKSGFVPWSETKQKLHERRVGTVTAQVDEPWPY